MESINFQTSRLDYYRRHARATLPHLSWRKATNLALNFVELRLKVASPRSLPPYLKVESTPLCHMSCPGCGHHDPLFKREFDSSMKMGLDDFKRLIDPLAHVLLGISFSLRGEPLLSRNLPSLVKYAHDKNIGTSFPSNLSVPMDRKFAEEIVRSGLDAMYVSLDGATGESYSKYRIGGDFELVLKNVCLLSQVKRDLQTKTPRLIWKFVIFEHNQAEIPVVHQKYGELGFDEVELVQDYGSEAAKERERNFNRRLVAHKSGCYFPWNAMVVTSDGEVKPCCVRPKEFALGNVKDGPIKAWRGEEYRRLRSGFATDGYGEKMHPVCKVCVGLAPKPAAQAPVRIALKPRVAS
jgi:radical SAM protein with 4Fe4S-binding SPASM domain